MLEHRWEDKVTILTVLKSTVSKVAEDFPSTNTRVECEGGSGRMKVDNPMPNFHILLKAVAW